LLCPRANPTGVPFPPGDVVRRRRVATALLLASTALTTSLLIGQARADNLPVGGSVAAGSAAIATPSATRLNITQTTPSAVINWQSFSVGAGAAVTIQQPDSTSALLNRVTGATPSTIAGSLTANGQVYLVNPNGIAITRSGVVDTGGGFVASTLGITDADFQSGKRGFTGNGASAAVSNAGTITVGRGGFAALLGGTVSNSGNILVPLGKVGLGSGERATLDFSGDGFLQVAVPTTAGGKAALIRNSGTIKADGGSVVISAATAREAARNAVNISGLVQARSIGGRNGAIQIGGGAGGGVKISGRLDASSRRHRGGAIAVTGKDIALTGATVDASGRTGGGTINVGGGRQGEGPLQRADTVSIDKATVIAADASATGDGGNVTVWSDHLTGFAGTITARGGAQGGNGGEAEVSGKAVLDYTGFTDLSAARGTFGTLLLDPYNVTISGGADTTGGSFAANGNDSIINAAILQAALGGAHVTVSTGAGGAQAGNITVASALSWATATTLTLNAAGAIAINAPIAITGAGGLVLTATAQAGITSTGLSFGAGASVTFGPTDVGGSFSLNGLGYTLVYTMAQLDAIDGVNAVNGTALTTYGAGVAGRYALANDLTATGTTYTMALVGTNSSDTNVTRFRGLLDGLGHTITGLTIVAPGTDYVGLIGYKVNRSVSNIGLVNGSVSGHDRVGALIGYDDSGTVQGSYVTGSVTGHENVGGLVGLSFTAPVQSSYSAAAVTGVNNTGGLVGETNFGSRLINAYATGTVTGTGDNTGGLVGNNSGGTMDGSYATAAVSGSATTGGLAGYNNQIIQNSHASGAVTGGDTTGGLVGRNDGTLTTTYATGTVGGQTNTGGLVGYNLLTVQDSYATGAVTGVTTTGGLIGANNFGTVSVLNSYATGTVTGTGDNTGGLIGDHSSGTVDSSYATGAVAGVNRVGGLVGYTNQTIQNSHATGTVTGSDSTGGLLGLNEGIVDHSYATGAISGVETTGGLVGYSTATSVVQNSYATGAVSGTNNTGGLIGATNFGTPTVQNSYATGAVTGSNYNTGGLIGQAGGGSIDGSYATGAVSGVNYTGGLAGSSTQTIQNSYATGAVTGDYATGGLVGYHDGSGSIQSSYAMGAVLGNDGVGGLVGVNTGGSTLQTSYATGAVTGNNNVGGAVGFSDGGVSSVYWDLSTSGQPGGIGGGDSSGATGLTTAQLQGGVATALGGSFGGGTGDLYPYLVSMFPGGVQAVSGIAYKDAGTTVAASGIDGAVPVGLTVGGVAQAPVTTGANGYYYFAVPMGSISSAGTWLLATTTANGATGAQNGAAIARATGTTAGLDILGGSSNFITPALTYSTSGYDTVISYPSTPAFVATLPTAISATGVSFTLDQALTVARALTVRTTATNAALIVGAPITLDGANTLTLSAAGALTINAPVSVTGGGAVVLAAAAQSGLTTTGLTFGNGANIDYGATDNGGSFSLNGVGYTLIYAMSDLDAIDGKSGVNGSNITVFGSGVTGNYALATNLVAPSTPYTRAVVADFAGFNSAYTFSGRLDGLGHTVTGLLINAPTRDQVGLIGYLAGGTVSNIGIVGGRVVGRSSVGALVGNIGGAASVVQNSYASATIASVGIGNSTGGLAGVNLGTVQSSYANGAVAGGYYAGGLVGYNFGGTIRTSYATGQVNATVNTGGLVGLNTGTIADSYATGSVFGGDQAGGLLGTNSTGGSVQQSYSTGMVSGATNVGGLIGSNYATVASSYWDSETSGRSVGMGSDSQSQSANVTSRTTAQLQSGSVPSGFGAAWSVGAGLYPYLSWQFIAGSTPQSVSGTAYQADSTVLAGASVSGTVNGTAIPGVRVSTGANGYYYFVMPQGSIAAGNDVFTYVSGNTIKANSFLQGATGSVQNLDLHGGMLSVTTGATTLSSVAAGLTSVVGATSTGNLDFTTPGGVLTPNAATALSITASGAFSVDQALTVPAAVLIRAAGSLGIASTGTVNSSGGNATLVAGTTFVNSRGADALSAAGGRWLVYSGNPADDTRGGLVYDFKQYAASYGLTAVAQATGNGVLYSLAPTLTAALTGTVTKTYDGNQTATLAASNLTATGLIDGDTATFASLGTASYLTRNAGSGLGVTAVGIGAATISNGSAAIYGYGMPGTTATGNIGTISPRAVSLSGSQTYSGTTAAAAANLSVDNLVVGDNAGLSGTGTMASANAGTEALTSTSGALSGLSVSNGNYTVTGGSGTVTVTPADVTVTALGGSSVYGSSPANPGLAASGLQNGETVAVLGGLSNSFGINATSGVASGPYTLTVAGTPTNANYTIVARNSGIWSVTPADVTVTALGGSSVYGSSPANPGLAASGLQNGETAAMLGGLSNSFGITANSDVASGPYTLTVAGTPTNPNYTIVARNSGIWSVTPADVTVTALGGSSVYGSSPDNPGFAASGLQNGETVAVLGGLSNSFGITATSDVASGPYTLTVAGTPTNPNYTVVARNSGIWRVTPADISVTALGGSSVYGSSPANPGFAASGLQNGETVAVLGGLSNSFGITATSDVASGPYTLTVAGTPTNANYAIVARNSGIWNVTPADVTVTALGGSSVYGSSPANPGLAASGLQNGETAAMLGGLSNSFGITATSDVASGPYTLTVAGTPTNPNYTIVARNSGIWSVTPADVTVTALGGSSVYGSSPANPGLAASGLQNGETVAVLGGLSNSFGITATSDVASNPYILTVAGAPTNPNYTVVARDSGIWTVTPAGEPQPQPPSSDPGTLASMVINAIAYPTWLLPDARFGAAAIGFDASDPRCRAQGRPGCILLRNGVFIVDRRFGG